MKCLIVYALLNIWTLALLTAASPILLTPSSSERVPDSTKKECEQSGSCFVVGDMIINTEKPKNGSFGTNSAVVNRAWPDGIVPYVIDSSVTGQKLQNVKAAIQDLNDKTCIALRKKTSSDKGYININAQKSGCFSTIGYTRREQPVNIGRGCDRKGTVIHEIMHALGFYHEQARDDRDDFVKIHFENIESGKESQFYKTSEFVNEEVSDYGVTYNYESVMHYDPQAFSDPRGSITIESLNNKNAIGSPKRMGQREGLTPTDIEEINAKYQTSKCNNRK